MRERDPMDMSFVDRRGNIVRPNREDYEATRAKQIDYHHEEGLKINKQYDSLIKQYGKDSEEVYDFESKFKMKRDKRRGIGGVFAILGIATSIFFLSTNITGNVVGNLTQNSTNVVGALLLVIGLIAGYFWMKKK